MPQALVCRDVVNDSIDGQADRAQGKGRKGKKGKGEKGDSLVWLVPPMVLLISQLRPAGVSLRPPAGEEGPKVAGCLAGHYRAHVSTSEPQVMLVD